MIMTISQSLLSFALTAFVMAITPGLDTALVLRTATTAGREKAVLAALGVVCGCLAWGVAVATGLGALLAASRPAFDAIRITGAAYLLWAGGRMLLFPRRDGSQPAGAVPDGGRHGYFLRGMLQNLLNPKVGVFYISFLPQFVPGNVQAGPYLFLLSGLQAALSCGWLVLVAFTGHSLGRLLRRASIMRAMDRLTGCVFIGFGLRLGLSRG
ncbi:amino acid efflux protein [Komagataeibacter rhaeticus DSM 16663]|nr:amino acid efflux protein [Komagataeibacter rhaeticus DSM 16663]